MGQGSGRQYPKSTQRPVDALARLTPRIGTDRARNPSQFYRTPPEAAIAFLNVEARRIRYLSRRVHECASGEGDLARVIAAYGFDVVASDIRRGAEIFGQGGKDFLKARRARATVIITNPPFGEVAHQFIAQARRLKVLYLALLLPTGFFQGAAANVQCFLDHPPSRIWPLGFRLDFTRAGKALANAYAWFVWDWGRVDRTHDAEHTTRLFGRPASLTMPALAKPVCIEVPA